MKFGKKNNVRCGLIIFDKKYNIYILALLSPYNMNSIKREYDFLFSTLIDTPSAFSQPEYIYPEKLSIPRGGKKSGECGLSCAIREFIEETKQLPHGEGFLCENPFKWTWSDCNKTWIYDIYVIQIESFIACTKMAFCYTIIGKINLTSINITFVWNPKLETPNHYIQLRQHEKRFMVIKTQLDQYLNYIKCLQIKTYQKSNYQRFVNWLLDIKKQPDLYLTKRILFSLKE